MTEKDDKHDTFDISLATTYAVFSQTRISKGLTYSVNTRVTISKGLEYQTANITAVARRVRRNKADFLQLMRQTMGVVSVVCNEIGISRNTFYVWCKEDPQFARELEQVKLEQRGEVEDRLLRAILRDEGWAIRLYLERKHPDYRPKQDNYLIPATKTLEDLIDEAREHGNEQPTTHREPPLDQEQTGSTGTLQSEPEPRLLLAEEDKKKPDPQSASKGNQ